MGNPITLNNFRQLAVNVAATRGLQLTGKNADHLAAYKGVREYPHANHLLQVSGEVYRVETDGFVFDGVLPAAEAVLYFNHHLPESTEASDWTTEMLSLIYGEWLEEHHQAPISADDLRADLGGEIADIEARGSFASPASRRRLIALRRQDEFLQWFCRMWEEVQGREDGEALAQKVTEAKEQKTEAEAPTLDTAELALRCFMAGYACGTDDDEDDLRSFEERAVAAFEEESEALIGAKACVQKMSAEEFFGSMLASLVGGSDQKPH